MPARDSFRAVRRLAPVLRRVPVLGAGRERVLLELDLGRGVAEAPPGSPLEAVRSLHTPLLRALVGGLRRAERDGDVVGLVAAIPPAPLTLAQSAELRAAVRSFAATGRPTVAWSPAFGELSGATTAYHLASGFDEVWLQPSGAVGLVGFAAEAPFVREALDKVGVEPQLHQRHEFKTAADLFLRSEMSEPHRAMVERMLASATETVVADVAAGRGLAPDAVRAVLDAGPLPAAEALRRGLVDRVGYRDEAWTAAQARVGSADRDGVTRRFVERHRADHPLRAALDARPRRSGQPVVALVQVSGSIVLGRSGAPGPGGSRSVGSDTVGAALRAAGRDDDVAAVVLRVDSPGGSYVASDAIRREVQVLRDAGTPVVASMASVAASGGYFVAMPCTEVVAGAGTITGSIGVLAGKIVLREALGRLGVHRDTVAGSRHAAMFSSNVAMDDEQVALLDGWLDDVYADFTAKAAADRGLDVEALREHARGRVWTGADAAERGLVDRLGGLEDAVRAACRLADVGRDDVEVRAAVRAHPLQALTPPQSTDAAAAALAVPAWSGEGPVAWQRLLAAVAPDLGAALGAGSYAGVLSLPPLHAPGLLPRT